MMRTTIDLPEREHALFTELARARGISFSKLVLELALRGLKPAGTVAEARPAYELDDETGLPLFHSGSVTSSNDVDALEDEELGRYGPFA
ncbi:MAG TPA: hypothetical protein VFN09_08870 [Rhodanobacteraceae bacterium]|nr:hypothetical protein [Rhodanobacteraceae bacterium]